MKTSIRILALALAITPIAHSAPFLAAGNGAELFLTGTLGVRVDDNIFLGNTKVDDVIFEIVPGVDFVFGKGSNTEGHLSYQQTITRYSTNSGANDSLAGINFSSNYSDGKSKFGVTAGYNELNQNTVDTGNGTNLSPREVVNFGLKGETSVTAKSKVAAAVSYKDTNYKTGTSKDSTDTTVPLDYYYGVSEKVDINLGVKFRTTSVQGGNDSDDFFFRLGARGEFSPKASGFFQVGYGQRELKTGGNKDIIDLDARFDFALSAKSSLRLTASNDFGVSAAGEDQINTSFGGIVTSNISDQLSLKIGAVFRKIDYITRVDDFFEGQLGADYIINSYVTIHGGYAYRNNGSGFGKTGDFTNNVFSLSGKIRY